MECNDYQGLVASFEGEADSQTRKRIKEEMADKEKTTQDRYREEYNRYKKQVDKNNDKKKAA